MLYKPCGPRVLVKFKPVETRTASGIFLAVDEQRQATAATEGEIVGVGSMAWADFHSPWAAVGDEVLFAKYAGKTYQDPETKEWYALLNDTDIIGVKLTGQ